MVLDSVVIKIMADAVINSATKNLLFCYDLWQIVKLHRNVFKMLSKNRLDTTANKKLALMNGIKTEEYKI